MSRHIAVLDGLPSTQYQNERSHAARHADAVHSAILNGSPDTVLSPLPIFDERLVCNLATVVSALERASELDFDIVHCSFGVPRYDPALNIVVQKILERQKILVASAPARGGQVWPASIPGVLSVQGDARCQPTQWSWLDLPNALLGACPHSLSDPQIGGASIAAAHLTGLLATLPRPLHNLDKLRDKAAFLGRERRVAGPILRS